ncbi:MAG: phosphate ABC transporter substrate-binding protein [Desulfitobacteriaceae bacterium]|nr:phosphate ABC transporter substrate-binding protein [Desulfitobacteriaceae bacterium]MDD4752475.1 phosphate ABC transporter substrate-binding protein [Desulfitobacteriaceae bacterium]
MLLRKNALAITLTLILVVVVTVAGCGKGSEQGSGGGSAELSGSLQLAGSTSVQPLAEELAAAFMAKNSDVKIDVQGGGSSAGVKAAAEGVANIGMASRELKDDETALGIVPTVIAKDGIAVVVNSANQVSGLSLEQIKDIFTGTVTSWKDLGGADAPIVVVNREEGSGTRGAFEELVLGEDVKFTERAAIQNSTGAVRTAVSSDPNAVGYISMGSLDDCVKALKVDGTEPTVENILSAAYKISRPFNFLTKGEANELSEAFIDWILSAEGQEIVAEEFVPISK